MGTWERQAELFSGSSAMAVWKTAMLDITTRTARPLVQVIEQVLAQPFNALSQHESDLTGAAGRSADGSIDDMLDVATWGLSMPQAIGAAEAVIGLATRARRAIRAMRKRAMKPFSARQAVLSRGFLIGTSNDASPRDYARTAWPMPISAAASSC